MKKMDVYFAILKKYPNHLLDISYGIDDGIFDGIDDIDF